MVSTRSQHNKAVHAKAATTPLQDTVFFSKLQDLISFVEIAVLKPEYGVVITHLSVTMSVSALERDILQKVLGACLTLTPNLIILELVTTPSFPIDSLDNIVLPRIEVLKTNIPHRALSHLVTTHPSLRALDILSCGRAVKCPLASFNVDYITEIRAPIKCAPALVHGHTSRLRLDSDGSNITASDVIPKITAPPLALYVLTVDFKIGEISILSAIATAFPQLRNLKLLEKSRRADHKHKPRPWSNLRKWSSSLKKMTLLEQLVIRTGAALTVQDNLDAETSVIQRWVDTVPRHPTLRHITVWQRVYDRGGVLSEWSREEGGKWEGERTVSPGQYHVMTFD